MLKVTHLLVRGSLVGLNGCAGAQKTPKTGATLAVRDAALPFKVLRARGGEEVSSETFAVELSQARAICVGENHPNPHHHWVQLHLLTVLGEAGEGVALGMEMFQRPFQGVLDDYGAGKIDEKALLSRAGWKKRWGYDWKLYSPMVKLAVERGIALVALNTRVELTKKVSKSGIDGLSVADREQLPELVLDDAAHRAWWDQVMADMGGAHGHSNEQEDDGHEGGAEAGSEHVAAPAKSQGAEHAPASGAKEVAEVPEHAPQHSTAAPHGSHEHGEKAHTDETEKAEKADKSSLGERIYAAQVLWDETMAETAAEWVKGAEGRRIIILAGNGHCHDSAIVGRIKRRGVKEVVSVQPIIDDHEGNIASELASPRNDYLFVMHPETKQPKRGR